MNKATRVTSFLLALVMFLSVCSSALAQTGEVAIEDLDLSTWTNWMTLSDEGEEEHIPVTYGLEENIGKTVQTTEDNVWIYKEAKTSQNATDENVLLVMENKGTKLLVLGYVAGDASAYTEFYQVRYTGEDGTVIEGYTECRQLEVYEAPVIDMETDPVVVGDVSIKVEGNLPEGTKMKASAISDSLASAVADVFSLADEFESFEIFGYDLSLDLNGEKIQPGEDGVVVTLDGITVGEDDIVYVYHLMDDVDAIKAAVENGTAVEIEDADFAAQFPTEASAAAEATGRTDTVIVEMYSSKDSSVSIYENGFVFNTMSFSRFVIASGNSSISEPTDPDSNQRYIDESTDFWVMPGTTLVLHSYNGTAKVKWDVDENKNGLLLKDSTSNTATYTIVVSNSENNIGKTSKIVVQGKYTVNIIVKSKTDIVNETLTKNYDTSTWRFGAFPMVLQNSKTKGVPGEPNVNEYDFKQVSDDQRIYRPANTLISEEIVDNPNFTTSKDGTCTLGLVDYTGKETKKYIKLENIVCSNGKKATSWDDVLISAVSGTKGSDQNGLTNIVASDGVTLNTLTNAQIKANYEIIPYVIKLQTSKGYTWNVDFYVAPKKRIMLTYDLNPPEGYTTQDLDTPNAKTGTESNGITDTITSVPNTVNGSCWYKLYDINGSYWHFFDGWSTSKDGPVKYKAGNTITVYKDTTLYGHWTPIYQYILKFDPNGGTGDPADKKSAGERGNKNNWTTKSTYAFNWTEVPIREGYIFTGWSLNANDNTPEYGPTTTSYTMTGNYGKSKTETLYACWQQLSTLTLTKTVPESNANYTDEFEFKVTFTGTHVGLSTIKNSKNTTVTKNGNTATTTVKLKAGETVTFSGVPVGTTYKVVETANNDYTTTSSAPTANIVAAGNTSTFTNTLKTGTLKLTKQVKDSEFKSGTKEFTFKVKTTDALSANELAYIAAKAGSKYTWDASAKTLTVKVNVTGTANHVDSNTVSLTLPVATYTVTEDAAAGYTTTYNPATQQESVTNGGTSTVTVTNTASGKRDVTVRKVWEDDSNTAGARPESVKLKLTANANGAYTTADLEKELTAANAAAANANWWEHTFTNQEMYSTEGYLINYDLSEEVVAWYDGVMAPPSGSEPAFVATNTLNTGVLTLNKIVSDSSLAQPSEKTFNFTVKYNGDDASELAYLAKYVTGWNETDKTFPLSITVAEDATQNSTTVRLPVASYTVTEAAVTGYAATYAVGSGAASANPATLSLTKNGETVTITNTQLKQTVTVNKAWEDNSDKLGKRPSEITVRLHANGTEMTSAGTKTLTADGWTASWTDLPIYDVNGAEITYTVSEDAITNYQIKDAVALTTPVESTDQAGDPVKTFNLTNKILLGNLKITKEGMKNAESAIFTVSGSRGDKYQVALQNGSAVIVDLLAGDTYTVTEEGWSWRYGGSSTDNDAVIVAGDTVEVKYTNDDTEKWLYDESFMVNDKFTVNE